MQLPIADILEPLVEQLKAISHDLESMDAIFQLELKNEQSEIHQLKITEGDIHWVKGAPFEPTCTVKMSAKDFLALVDGKLNPATALFTGRIKIQGDRSQLKKLQSILKKHYRNVPDVI